MKLTISILMILFVFGNFWAQNGSVLIDKVGIDYEQRYYCQTSLGPKITIDDNGDVHVVYLKSYVTETDTGFTLLYKNLTDGIMDTIRDQQPERDIQNSRAFIGGGRGKAPLLIYSGVSTYSWQWGGQSGNQMFTVKNGKVIPAGIYPEKWPPTAPSYRNNVNIEVDSTGIAHCLFTNVNGHSLSYTNFDGTNFGEEISMYDANPYKDLFGVSVTGGFVRNATKGVDIAVTKDGQTVAIGGLHPWNNIDITYGTLGGTIWPDDQYTALDDGSRIMLFDTTGMSTGENLPADEVKPSTDLQLAYDDDGVLHVAYSAAWFSHYLDTLSNKSFAARNDENVDKWEGWEWWTTYIYLTGDTNAVYYGSGKPKPQIRYWNSNMATMARSINSHTKITESVYPKAGEEYKWWKHGVIDSGMAFWGNRTDCLIADVDLIINTDVEEGEPKAVVIWEEMMSDPIQVDEENIGYYKDIQISATNDFASWSTPVNLTNTPTIDEGEVSAFTDILDGKVHFVYYSDDIPGSDYWMRNTEQYKDKYVSTNKVNLVRKDQNVEYKYLAYDVNKLVGIKDEIIPYNFTLSQNYPNPFNPSTTIKYSLPVLGG